MFTGLFSLLPCFALLCFTPFRKGSQAPVFIWWWDLFRVSPLFLTLPQHFLTLWLSFFSWLRCSRVCLGLFLSHRRVLWVMGSSNINRVMFTRSALFYYMHTFLLESHSPWSSFFIPIASWCFLCNSDQGFCLRGFSSTSASPWYRHPVSFLQFDCLRFHVATDNKQGWGLLRVDKGLLLSALQ